MRTATRLLVVTLAVSLAACSAPPDGDSESSAAAAIGARPSHVPTDFVVTPNGYVHPSCLFEVKPGESVSENGEIVATNGSRRAMPACAHPRFDRAGRATMPMGERATQPAVNPGISHSWLADFNETVSGVTWQSATFTVPPAPYHQGSNIVFFFNAIEPSNGSEIIQPVLQWNQTGYSNEWTIASWYVDRFGRGFWSTPVKVNPGDKLSGYMYPQPNGGWFIGMNRNGAYETGFSITSPLTFNWVFGGAMEVYNVNSCEDLPDSNVEFFNNETIYQNGKPITPKWTNQMFTVGSPNCNVSAGSGTTLGYITWLSQ